MSHPPFARRALALWVGALACGAFAADEPNVSAPAVEVRSNRADDPRDGLPQTTLDRNELQRRDLGNIGSAVNESPGVHSSSFGPGVGLPVIRGMSGPRVKVTVGGIGTHDASSVSPDHAVAAEPVLAERIRVLRGPATIRYGGGAIGGVVEVEDGRIPKSLPKNGFEAAAEARYNNNGAGRTTAFRADGGAGPMALHVDGFYRERNDIDIPGKAIDEAAVLRQFGLRPTNNTTGTVGNTSSRAHGATVGSSFIGGSGFLGLSVGTLSNNYGIPAGAHVSHSHGGASPPAGPDTTRIDMQQSRVDAHGLVTTPWRFLEAVEAKAGYVNYRHDEVDRGQPFTTFRNRAVEGRLELMHRWSDRFSGSAGLQTVNRTFSAIGAEAFVPISDIRSNALFVLEQFEHGPLKLEASARQEVQHIAAQPQRTVFDTVETFPGTTYRPMSYAAAGTWRWTTRNALTLTWSRAQRAPEVQELYALGPHLATRSFDIGNQRLRKESMEGPDVSLRLGHGRVDASINLFDYRARNYIHQANTGLFYDTDIQEFQYGCVRLDQCLAVLQYTQKDVRLRGYEAQLGVELPNVRNAGVRVSLFTDAVQASFTDGSGDVPRISPRRTGTEITVRPGPWSFRLRYTRVEPQNRAGDNETTTAGYDLLNLYVDFRVKSVTRGETVLFVNATNLLDAEIRNATSFLRSFAPEPGRAIEFGVRATF
ncbi:MAG: TonB-dependent receptor [Burkholderiales bacterium]|nr:TonB-dependent receptor [Burkholderiales bacterium]